MKKRKATQISWVLDNVALFLLAAWFIHDMFNLLFRLTESIISLYLTAFSLVLAAGVFLFLVICAPFQKKFQVLEKMASKEGEYKLFLTVVEAENYIRHCCEHPVILYKRTWLGGWKEIRHYIGKSEEPKYKNKSA